MRFRLPLAALASAVLGACNPQTLPGPVPVGSPGGSLDGAAVGTAPWLSNPGVEIRGGGLDLALAGQGGAPLAGALLRLYGPTLACVRTDAQGKAALSGLAPGDYRLVAEASGFQTTEWTGVHVELGKRTVPTLQPLGPGAALTGTVQDEAGAPLAGVVVSDGLVSAVSDAAGAFTLAGLRPGSVTLSANKPGYMRAEREVAAAAAGAGSLTWRLAAGAKTVLIDTSLAVDPPALTQAVAALGEAGFTTLQRLDQAPAVWVLVRPTQALDPDRTSAVRAFVAQGGTLVVLGEWGGSGTFRADRTDGYLHPLGVHLDRDLIRFGGSDAGVANVLAPAHPALRGLSGLAVAQAASVFALPPAGALIAPPSTAYRLQAAESAPPLAVVAGGAAGAGKVLVSGDTSAFTDSDADGNGVSNFRTGDNAKAWVQLLSY